MRLLILLLMLADGSLFILIAGSLLIIVADKLFILVAEFSEWFSADARASSFLNCLFRRLRDCLAIDLDFRLGFSTGKNG
jgi:hypothetical protein